MLGKLCVNVNGSNFFSNMDEGTLITIGTIGMVIAFIVMSVWPITDKWFDNDDDNDRIDKW